MAPIIKPKYMGIVLFLLLTWSRADYGPVIFSFSRLLANADLIAAGTVVDVSIDLTQYRMTFDIDDCITGPCEVSPVEVVVPMLNGFYDPDEPYLDLNEKYLLFLHSDSAHWSICSYVGGVFKTSSSSDIRRIVQAHQSNPDLFSVESVDELKSLFFSFEQRDSKVRLLIDLEHYLTAGDEHFLATLMESSDEWFVMFSVKMAGRLKIESLKPRIEALLESGSDIIIFCCLVALGDYGNPESLPLVLAYLDNPDQGTRRVAIEAARKIGTVDIIQPLREWYPNENDTGNRCAIIEAIYRLEYPALVSNTFEYLLSIETESFLRSLIEDYLKSLFPKIFKLEQNYPNPFNPATTIRYELPEDAYVTLAIYDILGQEVVRLVDRLAEAGYNSVVWNGKDRWGNPVAIGVYIYSIQANQFSQSRKMLLLR